MKVLILGGGPAGLYFGLLLKKANPQHDITLIERNPRHATYGWGVVFSDRTLASFREADYKTYTEITDSFVIWDNIDVWYRGQVRRCGGNVFSGISRRTLLNILQNRCQELGVKLRFQTDITDLAQLTPSLESAYDLIVAADGVNSLVRHTYAHIFKPDLEVGKAKYIWLGTDKVFDAFTFIFQENEHGLFQVHAYPFDGTTGTFIIECEESAWRRAGLEQAGEAESIAYCEQLFAANLGGHKLMSNNSKWINFVRVKNKSWRHRNIILLGDAAHTAHFSIGSGTKLAMESAIALVNAVEQHSNLDAALNDYELEQQAPRREALQRRPAKGRNCFGKPSPAPSIWSRPNSPFI
ncbi:MAG: FAD-dependent monooxygenase [Anaerolineae bacterium]